MFSRCNKLQPLLIKFGSEEELYDWHADLMDGMNSVHATTATPGDN